MKNNTKTRVKNKKWKILSSNFVLETPWLKVKKDKILLPNGKIIDDFFSIEGSELVAILAVNDRKQVLLIKQYRHAVKKETFDLPGGGAKAKESSSVAARRELLEETGYSAGRLEKMLTYYPDSGKKGDIKHIFLAKNLKKNDKVFHGTENGEEIVDIKWVPLNELADNITKGKFKEATLQLAVLYYIHYLSNSKDGR